MRRSCKAQVHILGPASADRADKYGLLSLSLSFYQQDHLYRYTAMYTIAITLTSQLYVLLDADQVFDDISSQKRLRQGLLEFSFFPLIQVTWIR